MNEKDELTLEIFESTIAGVMSVMESGFEYLGQGIEHLKVEMKDVKGKVIYLEESMKDVRGRVIHLEESMEEVQESLHNLENAEEKDAKASINHEFRIQKLEKINKIKPKPVDHLASVIV